MSSKSNKPCNKQCRTLVTAGIRSAAILTISFAMTLSAFAGGGGQNFPKGPDLRVTQGSVCQQANHYRYPERIAYCERDVESALKKDIIDQYENEFGYKIWQEGRGNFKIDHLIPLCAGGSNQRDNLWPQHKTIYAQTDPLEPLICQKMSEGKLKQAVAILWVKEAKLDLAKVPEVMARLQAL